MHDESNSELKEKKMLEELKQKNERRSLCSALPKVAACF
jgi:hypothetical protein